MHCLACLSASLPSLLSLSRLAIFSLHYSSAHGPQPASRPAPGPVQSLITHAHTRWSRYHQARLPPFTPWTRLTLLPRALTSAHPQSSITSPPQVTQPRRPHQHCSQQPSRDALPTRHDSLHHPQAVAAHHEPTITACSHLALSGLGLVLIAPASRAPHRTRPPHATTGATRLSPPPPRHSASDCGRRTLHPPAATARDTSLSHAHARPRNWSGPLSKGAYRPLSPRAPQPRKRGGPSSPRTPCSHA